MKTIQFIQVKLSGSRDRSYRIHIRPRLLAELPGILRKQFRDRSIFIITDSQVAGLYGGTLQQRFASLGLDVLMLDIPSGEQSKNFRVVHSLHTQLLEAGIRRDSVIVALGGGVAGDVAGYVAATVLRGVSYIQVPTTLLAQVDSSVGGKVGIDHPLGKNLVGAFHQPEAVYIDPEVLRTLPATEFRNGLAEVVKIAAALDKKLFTFIERNSRRILKHDMKVLTALITESVGLKASVVSKDERESGLRKVLNLGHTIGHAVEAGMKYEINHGEAVAIGLAIEARIAWGMGILPAPEYERLSALLTGLNLPTHLPGKLNKARFRRALALDKKSDAVGVKFVLLKAIGKSVVGVNVPLL